MDAFRDDVQRAPSGPRQFACFAMVDPSNVWSFITGSRESGGYLYGLAAHSSWEADAPIEFHAAEGYSLIGRVLHVEEPRRLSYVLQAGPDDPPTYLTWQIRACSGGSAIRLQVDEIDSTDDDEAAENVWLPVLAALQSRLAAHTTDESRKIAAPIEEPADDVSPHERSN